MDISCCIHSYFWMCWLVRSLVFFLVSSFLSPAWIYRKTRTQWIKMFRNTHIRFTLKKNCYRVQNNSFSFLLLISNVDWISLCVYFQYIFGRYGGFSLAVMAFDVLAINCFFIFHFSFLYSASHFVSHYRVGEIVTGKKCEMFLISKIEKRKNMDLSGKKPKMLKRNQLSIETKNMNQTDICFFGFRTKNRSKVLVSLVIKIKLTMIIGDDL